MVEEEEEEEEVVADWIRRLRPRLRNALCRVLPRNYNPNIFDEGRNKNLDCNKDNNSSSSKNTSSDNDNNL